MKGRGITELLYEAIPFLVLGGYILAVVLLRIHLPPAEQIVATISEFYKTYGYPFIFVSGVLESLFMIGFYFPGSAAILLGAALAKTGVVFLPFIILFGTLGILLGYTLNYFLGKYGWYKILSRFGLQKGIDIAEQKLEKHGGKAFFIGYLSPNSASLLSTAAGVTGYPFSKFLLYSVIAQSFWSIVWGSIAYILGDLFIDLFLKYAQYLILLIVGIIVVQEYLLKPKSNKT